MNLVESGFYYLADAQGSIRLLRNSISQLKASYSYDAYGSAQCTMPGGPTECEASTPFGYTGQYQDQESGLLYLRARYYDPATEQFLTRDPLEQKTGQPYVYAYGNPVNFTDPTGLEGIGAQDGLPPRPVPVPRTGGGRLQGAQAAQTGSKASSVRTIYHKGVQRVLKFNSQREARRAAMKAAGIGRNGPRTEDQVPLHKGSRSPQGPPGVRTEWTNISNKTVVHHDPYGNYTPSKNGEPEEYLGPHYGVKAPGGETFHYAYPSTHDPRLNR